MFPAAAVLRRVDGFAQDGRGMQEDDGFHFFGEPGLQVFVDFQAVVIPVAGVVKRKGEFMGGNVVDIADVVSADVPEFDLVFAGDEGCFQEVQIFAENDDWGPSLWLQGYLGVLINVGLVTFVAVCGPDEFCFLQFLYSNF